MTNLHNIFKEGMDITLLTKVQVVKAMAIQVVMYGCESWTAKKAEHQRTVAFELWWRRRLLWVHCAARRWNQSILKHVNPEHSLEGPMLSQKLQYFGHLMPRTNSLEKTLTGKYWRQKEKRSHRVWDGCMASPTHRTEVWANSGRQWRTGQPGCCSPWGHKEPDTTERMNHKTFLQRRHVHVQQAREEMFNILNHHTHANKSHNGIEIGHHQKEHSYEISTRM